MKKILYIVLVSVLVTVSATAQTTPQGKTRTDGEFTQIDYYLNIIKRLGIPTSNTDALDASTSSANTAKIIWNTSLNKLRVYDGVVWRDAIEADLSPYYNKSQVDSLLVLKANDADVLHKTGDETKSGELTLNNALKLRDKVYMNDVQMIYANPTVYSITLGNGGAGSRSHSTALGFQALGTSGTGGANTAIGFSAMNKATDATRNTSVGWNSLYSNTGGDDNTAIGYRALYSNTADGNTAIGRDAMLSNSSGTNNTAIGRYALYTNTTSSGNTAVGHGAIQQSTTQGENTGVGYRCLFNGGSKNTAVGYQAITGNGGSSNAAFGHSALYSNYDGFGNVAIGMESLNVNHGGDYNVAIGFRSLLGNKEGGSNIAIGSEALRFSNGSGSLAIGHNAGYDITTGSGNAIVGYNSGRGITTGKYNTILGSSVTNLPEALSNNIIIADGQGNQRIRILDNGNTGIGTTTPSAKLDVAGDGNFTGTVSAANPTATNHLATKAYVDGAVAGLTPAYIQALPVYDNEDDLAASNLADYAPYRTSTGFIKYKLPNSIN